MKHEVIDSIGRSQQAKFINEGSRKWLKSDILEWMEQQKRETEKIVNFRHTDNTVVRTVRKVR